ncbi:hypothetical protein ACFYYM_31240 [Streptomyces erythrochromogenes]|uniref:hypothetical protein n=1 Tax=Streptomyces erythrochromogenes TaxID=285574 RepID=UPI003689BC8C
MHFTQEIRPASAAETPTQTQQEAEASAFERDRAADMRDLARALNSYYSRAESPYFKAWWEVQERLDEIETFRRYRLTALNTHDGRERITSADGRLTYALPQGESPRADQFRSRMRAALAAKDGGRALTSKDYPKAGESGLASAEWRSALANSARAKKDFAKLAARKPLWAPPASKRPSARWLAELDTAVRATVGKDGKRKYTALPQWEQVTAETEAAPGVWLPAAAVALADTALETGFTVAMERRPDGRVVVRFSGSYVDGEGRERHGELAAVWDAAGHYDAAASVALVPGGQKRPEHPGLHAVVSTAEMKQAVTATELTAPGIATPSTAQPRLAQTTAAGPGRPAPDTSPTARESTMTARMNRIAAAGTDEYERIRLADNTMITVKAQPDATDFDEVAFWSSVTAPDTEAWAREDLFELWLTNQDVPGRRLFLDVPVEALREFIEQHGGEHVDQDGPSTRYRMGPRSPAGRYPLYLGPRRIGHLARRADTWDAIADAAGCMNTFATVEQAAVHLVGLADPAAIPATAAEHDA